MSIAYRRNSECPTCLEVRPLLMPVSFYPGTAERVTVPLCVACRVGWVDDWRFGVLASTWDHCIPTPSRSTP